MVNNRGFLRTLEAVVAILIILALIVYLAPSKKLETGVPSNVKEAKEFILKEILTNKTLRECISDNIGDCKTACESKLKNFISSNVPFGYDYGCEICGAGDQGCANLRKIQDKNVYSGVIYLNFDKTFRLFLYEK